MTTMTDARDILARLARMSPGETPEAATIDERLGLPPGFVEVMSAVWLAYQHEQPALLLEAAAAVHGAWATGCNVFIEQAGGLGGGSLH